MIAKAIAKAFSTAKARNWDTIFVAVDIHDTVVVSNYSTHEIPTTFYPGAKEALQYLSDRRDVDLIMFTSSNPKEIYEYLKFFASFGIFFDSVNENPKVVSQGYGCYDRKFYFNLMIEDKAGFDAQNEWKEVLLEFKKYDALR